MTRGVNKGNCAFDALVSGVNLVSTDVLSNSTSFASNHVCTSDGVQKLGLTVVNVTHNGDDWRSGLQVLVILILDTG